MTGSSPGTAYRAGAFTFTVQSSVADPDGVIARLMSVFGTAPGEDDAARYTIAADPERAGNYVLTSERDPVPDVTALGTIVDWVIADVTRRGVASLGTTALSLHAGAVALDGAGVILPGISGAGKSTLAAGLVAAGASYLSDEVAVIDAPGRTVRPFPRPLVLDPDSVRAIDGLEARIPASHEAFRLLRYHVTPQDLGSTVAEGPVPIALVVLPEFAAGAATTVEPLSRGALLAALASHLFGTMHQIEKALPSLRDLALVVPGYRIRGGALQDARDEVHRLLASLT
jgi:hypothetical protein